MRLIILLLLLVLLLLLAQVKANTVTADGVIFNIKAAVSQSGAVAPSLTTIYSPSSNLMLMGIFGADGSVTGASSGLLFMAVFVMFAR
jgi:ribosomal protein L11 methylase PrmA